MTRGRGTGSVSVTSILAREPRSLSPTTTSGGDGCVATSESESGGGPRENTSQWTTVIGRIEDQVRLSRSCFVYGDIFHIFYESFTS